MGKRAALRLGDRKVVHLPEQGTEGKWELYDLARDPGESNDLAATEPEILARLVAEWERIDAGMVEPLF